MKTLRHALLFCTLLVLSRTPSGERLLAPAVTLCQRGLDVAEGQVRTWTGSSREVARVAPDQRPTPEAPRPPAAPTPVEELEQRLQANEAERLAAVTRYRGLEGSADEVARLVREADALYAREAERLRRELLAVRGGRR